MLETHGKLLLFLLLIWGIFANFLYLIGLLGLLCSLTVIPLFGLVVLLSLVFGIKIISATHLVRLPSGLLGAMIFIVLLYASGIPVPDTGFDSIWYHLPEAQVYAVNGRIAPIPELLYSTMPRLAEMLFIPGFLMNSFTVVNFTVFFLFIFLVITSFYLAHYFLSTKMAFFFTLAVVSLYPLAWQSTSAYVDIPRSLFELGGLIAFLYYLKTTKSFYLALMSILVGFSLSTKIQAVYSLLSFIPLFLVLPNPLVYRIRKAVTFIFLSVLVAFPWYLDNYLHRGHVFYPVNLEILQSDILAFSGVTSPGEWLLKQAISLPTLPLKLSFSGSGLVSPLIPLLLPLLFSQKAFLWLRSRPLVVFTTIYLLIWWLIPPAEVRYALTPIITTILLGFIALNSLTDTMAQKIVLLGIFLAIAVNVSIRLAVSVRYLPVLLGNISSQQYLDSQATPFNRIYIDKLYRGYWSSYRYPSPSPSQAR